MINRRTVFSLALLAFGLVAGGPALANVDFSGKTVTIVVGFGAGGGYDAYARLAASHLGNFLPGHPSVIVDNMPGGGGRRAEAYLATVAPKDGTVISIVPNTIGLDSLEGLLPHHVSANDFSYIGRMTSAVVAEMTWKSSPTRTVADAKKRVTIVASTGRNDVAAFIPTMMNALFGTRFKVVHGYKGTSDMAMAMERGEVEGMSMQEPALQALHPDWLKNKSVNILWQAASKRRPGFEDVPAIVEFATNNDQRSLLRLATSTSDMGRSLAAPPGVPKDIVAAYRSAFDAMLKDKAFVADARRQKLELDGASGQEIQSVVSNVLASPKATVDAFLKIMSVPN